MSPTVEIDSRERLICRFPYDPELQSWLKERKAKWDPEQRAWVLPRQNGNSQTLAVLMQMGFEVV